MKPTRKITQLITAVLFFTALSIVSCNKETSSNNSLTPEEESQAAEFSTESDAEAETIFNGIFDDVLGVNDEVGMAGLGIFGQASPVDPGGLARVTACFTVSVKRLDLSQIFPVQIVIDFGSGCQGKDGRFRYGKIITTYSNRMTAPGAKATTTFDGFKIGDISIAGTHVITNTSTANIRQYTVAIADAKLTKPNGNYSEWISDKTFTQMEGLITPNLPLDDIFKIEGSASGKVKRDDVIVAWKNEIIEPLIKKFACRWIVKGKVKTERLNSSANSSWVALLNYGAGDCDNNATISINGVLHEISLH
jgi:hypothetical protein